MLSIAGALAFGGTLLVFLAYAVVGYRKAVSPEAFFHFTGVRRNLIALIVANVTLGTGLAYLLTAGSQNGLALLAVPAGVLFGYWALAAMQYRLPDRAAAQEGNLLLHLRAELEKARRPLKSLPISVFDLTITTPLIAVFLMVFAFEIFVSAKILGAIVAPGATSGASIAVGALIFVAALTYCMIGGMQSVFRNDVLQFFGILIFVGIIVYGVYGAGDPAPRSRPTAPSPFRWSVQIGVNALLAFIAAVATQFYSLLNIYSASNLRQRAARQRLMRWNGVIVALILAVFVVIGATATLDFSKGIGPALGAAVARFGGGMAGSLLVAFLVFGMTSVVISTADTLLVSLTYFVHQNLLRRPVQKSGREGLGRIRALMGILFGIVFVLLAVLFLLSPNLFFLLLSIASGPIVYAPLILVAALLLKREGSLGAVHQYWLVLYFVLFVSASFSSFAVLQVSPQLVPYLSIMHLFVACLAAVVIYRNASMRG